MRIAHSHGWGRASTPWHPALRAYLTGYVGYWEDLPAPSKIRLVASWQATMIINLGEPFDDVRLPGSAGRIGSLASGLEDAPGRYAHGGGQCGIQLDLTPLGAYRLYGVPMRELTNTAVDLSEVFGPAADTLVDRLRSTPDWATRFDLLDTLLLSRLDTGPEPAPEISEAWRLLTTPGPSTLVRPGTGARPDGSAGPSGNGGPGGSAEQSSARLGSGRSGSLGSGDGVAADGAGRIAVAELAAAVGWSNKHLISRFREQIGLPPKAVARIVRFQRAMEMLRHGVPGFVDVALACGYYDQAHFNREFRALAGISPSRLLAARRPAGDFDL